MNIEIRTPVTNEWVLIESNDDSLNDIVARVEKIKRIYPEYLVRAQDADTAKTLALV